VCSSPIVASRHSSGALHVQRVPTAAMYRIPGNTNSCVQVADCKQTTVRACQAWHLSMSRALCSPLRRQVLPAAETNKTNPKRQGMLRLSGTYALPTRTVCRFIINHSIFIHEHSQGLIPPVVVVYNTHCLQAAVT
jgi:hypothetical protein